MADKITSTVVATLRDHYGNPVTVRRVTGPNSFIAYIYQCPLNVDWDGAARAYGVDRPGFPLQTNLHPIETGLGNAKGSDGTWSGVFSANRADALAILASDPAFGPTKEDRMKRIDQFLDERFKDAKGFSPVVQILRDSPAPGYYVSQCPALVDDSKKPWDQKRYADASKVPYGALSDGLARFVNLFDFGLVIRNRTGRNIGFYFGDAAGKGSDKVG